MKSALYPNMTEFEKLIGVKSVAITQDDLGNTKDNELETRSDEFVCESCNAVVKDRQNQQTCGSDNEAGRKRQYTSEISFTLISECCIQIGIKFWIQHDTPMLFN